MRDKFKVEYVNDFRKQVWKWRIRRMRDWAVIATSNETFSQKRGAYQGFRRFVANVCPNIINIEE